MTGPIGSAITAKVVQKIQGPNGLNSAMAELMLNPTAATPLHAAQIRTQNVAAELVEKSMAIQYPAIHVYCEKIVNSMAEKFRRFSGSVQMAMEVRHSQDRLEGLQDTVELYAAGLTQLLDENRGDWGTGTYYTGGYQVSFGAVKHGGKNFTQTAKVTFEIGVSVN